MLKVLCLVIFVSVNQLGSCYDCTYSNYVGDTIFIQEVGATIFTQQFGESKLLLPGGSLKIPDKQSVTAFCPGNFRISSNRRENARAYGYGYQPEGISTEDYNYVDKIVLKCSSSVVTLETPYIYHPHSQNRDRDESNDIYCQSHKSDVCQYKVKGCNKDSYLHKLTIDGVTIVYAEICHDLGRQHTHFVHYVIAKRSPVLQHSAKYNPGWTKTDMTCSDIGHIADLFNLSDNEKDVQLQSLLGDFSKMVNYQSASLIPEGLFAPYFPEPEFGNWVNIYWWTPLKEGNWRMFQNALKNKSKEVDLDVYAGTSHTISFKTAGKCESVDQIKFKSNTLEKAVPLYVWNYIRERNSNDSAEVVVIGVNSPFTDLLDFHSNYTGICVDICEAIPWMNSLKHTMHMPALGYIMCCRPNEVIDLLEGFPKTVVSTFEEFETSPKTVATTTITSTTTTTAAPLPFRGLREDDYVVEPIEYDSDALF